ncbi:MAG: LPS assembly protein LptD [Magnetospirillum sp. WYHS-4]
MARQWTVMAFCCLLSSPVLAAAKDSLPADQPADFTADEMTYDKELGVVTARGKVEVTHGPRLLRADTISYNQKTDIVSASGNVSILEPSGEVMFAEYVDITGDLKEGVVRDFRMVLKDGARVAAAGGRRMDGGEKMEMHKAVYSPCDLCPTDPTRPPLWQVKAVKVIHDRAEQRIEYRDAWVEMAGIPVAYTPYLHHPDPTAKAKSGLLAPSFGGSSSLGATVRLPYYFAIDRNADATVTPIYTSKEGPILAGEFRSRPNLARIDGTASITQDSKDDVRGHVAAKGQFDIDRTWRWGFDANRSTDDTYLRRYKFGAGETQATTAYIEGFRQRNYFTASAHSFQNVRADVRDGTVPLVMPLVEYNHVGQPDRYGGRTSLDMSFLSLSRKDGTDTRHLSGIGGWQLPYTASNGSVYTLATNLQADAYHINKLQPDPTLPAYTGASARLHPEASLEWRHPFVRREGNASIHQLIEPAVQVVGSPNTSDNNRRLPNEDSPLFEFDDTNLFTMNRFPGLDRIERGARVNYGMKWGVFGEKGGNTLVRVGQSFRPREDTSFSENSGLEGNLSDVVASVAVQPNQHLNLLYRTRLDKEDFAPKRNEVRATVGVPALTASASYLFYDQIVGTEFPVREQVVVGLTSQITRFWRASASAQYDIHDENTQRVGLGAVYEDECFSFTVQAHREFFYDRDLRPSDAVMFTLNFKTLGDFRTGFTHSGQ